MSAPCRHCGHDVHRHWTIGAHLCSVAQGHNAKVDDESPCECPGYEPVEMVA